MTLYERIQTKSPEELAEYLVARDTALTDIIFRETSRILREKRGINIDFNKHFKPDLLISKKEILDGLNTEVPDAET